MILATVLAALLHLQTLQPDDTQVVFAVQTSKLHQENSALKVRMAELEGANRGLAREAYNWRTRYEQLAQHSGLPSSQQMQQQPRQQPQQQQQQQPSSFVSPGPDRRVSPCTKVMPVGLQYLLHVCWPWYQVSGRRL